MMSPYLMMSLKQLFNGDSKKYLFNIILI